MKKKMNSAMSHLANQREYVMRQQLDDQRMAASRASGRSGIVDEGMLAESMRSVRYHDEGHAAGDLADNAIESGANNFHVAYRTEGSTIVEMAFIDDGSGILREFLPHAVKWGGSSNLEGHRNIFGRFGFGLPSASVNRSRAYEVFSRTTGKEAFYSVTIDLDNLVNQDGVVPLPTVEDHDALPTWVTEYVESEGVSGKKLFPGGIEAVRTVVVWRRPDRLTWPNRQQSTARFREHFGITYAGWLDVVNLVVDGKPVEPVDVLFTTEGYRWYDIDGFDKAQGQSPITFDVKAADGAAHTVTVRFSHLNINAYTATIAPEGRGNHTKIRQKVRTEHNGIFMTRNGRFIELYRWPEITWNNYARQVGIAIDFPPELDELFGVTPDKQSIQLTPSMESMLESHGVARAFRALYTLVSDERSKAKRERDAAAKEGGAGRRPSEEVIAKVLERDVRSRRGDNEESREEAERNIRRRIKKLAEETGLDEDVVAEAQEKQQQARPYRVDFAHLTKDDTYYRPYMDGTQMVLEINTSHPWYREVYDKLTDQQAELRSALELNLWVLGSREIDSGGELRVFYRSERRQWSRMLADGLDLHPMVFHSASVAEVADLDERPWADDESEPADEVIATA